MRQHQFRMLPVLVATGMVVSSMPSLVHAVEMAPTTSGTELAKLTQAVHALAKAQALEYAYAIDDRITSGKFPKPPQLALLGQLTTQATGGRYQVEFSLTPDRLIQLTIGVPTASDQAALLKGIERVAGDAIVSIVTGGGDAASGGGYTCDGDCENPYEHYRCTDPECPGTHHPPTEHQPNEEWPTCSWKCSWPWWIRILIRCVPIIGATVGIIIEAAEALTKDEPVLDP